MPFNRETPYNDLPHIPPADVDVETKAILKQAISAHRALAELKGSGDLIPNQALLVRVIGLQEAKLSSEIENIVTTNDELYRAFSEDSERVDAQTKEVLRYNDALWHGYNELKTGRPLSTRLFEELYQIIKSTNAGVRKTTGTRIRGRGDEIVYTPPEGESRLRDLLANLEDFIYEHHDLDPLVKLAIMHYQFETIHPFSDGNGRTGRILNILYLIDSRMLDLPVLYLSRYIIQNKQQYYEGLRRVTEEADWENWILFMLRAIEQTAFETYLRILEIRNQMRSSQQLVRDKLPKVYSKDLIEVLFAQPYCRIRSLEQAGIAGTRQTAAKYLQELAEAGILERVQVGRESYYINRSFLNLLTKTA